MEPTRRPLHLQLRSIWLLSATCILYTLLFAAVLSAKVNSGLCNSLNDSNIIREVKIRCLVRRLLTLAIVLNIFPVVPRGTINKGCTAFAICWVKSKPGRPSPREKH